MTTKFKPFYRLWINFYGFIRSEFDTCCFYLDPDLWEFSTLRFCRLK